MDTNTSGSGANSLAQRVAEAYLRALAPLNGATSGIEGGRDLHDFFTDWYRAMAAAPASFGLPIGPDAWLESMHGLTAEANGDVTARVKKVQEAIAHGVDFLYLVGRKGTATGQALHLDGTDRAGFFSSHVKTKRKMIEGLCQVGLRINEADPAGTISLTSDRYPALVPALRLLAAGCALQAREDDALFHFSRCDLRAQTPDYSPDPRELYQVFQAEYLGRVAALHEFMLAAGYRPKLQVNGRHGWDVQYQGSRKVKSSPLLHVEYSVRLNGVPVLRLNCASANRLVALVEQQSQALQDDYFGRINPCARERGCQWCETRKGLGSAVLTHRGNPHLICWYTNPYGPLADDGDLAIVQEYVLMHEQLGKAGASAPA